MRIPPPTELAVERHRVFILTLSGFPRKIECISYLFCALAVCLTKAQSEDAVHGGGDIMATGVSKEAKGGECCCSVFFFPPFLFIKSRPQALNGDKHAHI